MKRDQDWDSMKHTAFSYSFTPKEFYFFLFKKPKCPDCGKKIHSTSWQNRRKALYQNEKIIKTNFNKINFNKIESICPDDLDKK